MCATSTIAGGGKVGQFKSTGTKRNLRETLSCRRESQGQGEGVGQGGEQDTEDTHWRRLSPWGPCKYKVGTREGVYPSVSNLGPRPAHPGDGPERQSQVETDTCRMKRQRWMMRGGACRDERETQTDRQTMANRGTQTEKEISWSS